MSHLGPWAALLLTIGILALSAFFVAAEFALVAARQHRLVQAAETSPAARAALKSARELTLLLAASQLGITVCTLALGAITKPAVHHAMTPVMEAWGLPEATADVIAFVLSLLVVTFLHLVLGEMAPKSWALAHPETSAMLLAVPIRFFMAITRPLLVALNNLANMCVRLVGVQPVDQIATARTADDLRQLVEYSAKAGTLDAQRYDQLTVALDLHTRTVDELRPTDQIAAVTPTATTEQIKQTARDTGHFRLLVRDDNRTTGMVHVRDTLTKPPHATAAELQRPVATLPADTPIATALGAMRDTRTHVAVIHRTDDPHHELGILTLDDLLDPLLTTNDLGPHATTETTSPSR